MEHFTLQELTRAQTLELIGDRLNVDMSIVDIVAKYGVTHNYATHLVYRIGISFYALKDADPKRAKIRDCMWCKIPIYSAHAGHRHCERCRAQMQEIAL